MIRIRKFRKEDEEDIRRICFDTALLGEPLAPHFADRRLVTDVLIGRHIWYEPESLYVAEKDGRVIGYLAGTTNNRRLHGRGRGRLAWRLLRYGARRPHGLRWRHLGLAVAALRYAWLVTQLSRRVDSADPAALHINMDRAYRGRGGGTLLLQTFLQDATAQGVPGVQVSTASLPGQRFFSKMGFTIVATGRTPAIAGQPPRALWLLRKTLNAGAD